jgi:DNA-directed RNA polymerase sigma subunit (sigma70/sigma32)
MGEPATSGGLFAARRKGEKDAMANTAMIPLSPEGGLSQYLADIRKFPMLEKDEEFMLAKRWVEHEDTEARTSW